MMSKTVCFKCKLKFFLKIVGRDWKKQHENLLNIKGIGHLDKNHFDFDHFVKIIQNFDLLKAT